MKLLGVFLLFLALVFPGKITLRIFFLSYKYAKYVAVFVNYVAPFVYTIVIGLRCFNGAQIVTHNRVEGHYKAIIVPEPKKETGGWGPQISYCLKLDGPLAMKGYLNVANLDILGLNSSNDGCSPPNKDGRTFFDDVYAKGLKHLGLKADGNAMKNSYEKICICNDMDYCNKGPRFTFNFGILLLVALNVMFG